MKKRILSLFLMAAMLFGNWTISFAEENISSDMAQAYLNVVNNAVGKYGVFNPYNYTGFGYADLIDFENDGVPELVIGCGSENDEYQVFFEVYGYSNGSAYKITRQNCCDSYQLIAHADIIEKNSVKHIVTYDDSLTESFTYLGTVKNGQWDIQTADGYEISRYYKEQITFSEDALNNIRGNLSNSTDNSQNKSIKVILNGNEIYFDVAPRIIEDRTMVPMRAIFEALGYDVKWDGSGIVTAYDRDNDKMMGVEIGKPYIIYGSYWEFLEAPDLDYFLSEHYHELDCSPVIIDDRTLVPVRAISEAAGCDVGWDGETQTVIITRASTSSNTNDRIGAYYGTNVPKYEDVVTGAIHIRTDNFDDGEVYVYNYDEAQINEYKEFLKNSDFIVDWIGDDGIIYYNEEIGAMVYVVDASEFGEVWIIP